MLQHPSDSGHGYHTDGATDISQIHKNQQQVISMLILLQTLPNGLGKIDQLLGIIGFCNTRNIEQCEAGGIDTVLTIARQEHILTGKTVSEHPRRCRRIRRH